MLFGVSMSIKKSVDKQVREERMKSEFDFSVDDESISSSLLKNNKNGEENYFKPHNINPSEGESTDGFLKMKKKKSKATTVS
jgi:hypothetical protein